MSTLGFCRRCLLRYEARASRRWRLIDAVCARLTAVGDPLFTVYGGRARILGAHVVAHLQELDSDVLFVPPSAVADYLEELDEHAGAFG